MMTRRIGLLAAPILLAAPLALAACHTTSSETLCREYVAARNDAVDYNKYSLVAFTTVGPSNNRDARCTVRNNQTFAQFVICIDGDTHRQYLC
jgi:hypothetical protein